MKSLLKKHVLLSLIFGVCLSWFFATVFIDFIAAPNIFRNVSSLKEAGTLGGIIFTSFNIIEMIFAVLLIIATFLYRKKGKTTFIMKFIAVTTLVLAIVYTTQLSPGIRDSQIAKSNYTHTDEEYQVFEDKLRGYHKLYVRLDSYKLLALLTMCGVSLAALMKLESKEGEA
ncbi:PF13664 domain protein [Bacteriovorax sp. BAL6_X]|uniref:DUF4149 domain-containing protein n=1 Tax=Bacteriovorax sp. BAL6_X TaxID=1201290 RepID=UPI000385DF4C|nr:DUF4149 domain-containing protein [Bacteriovorax sp. BAL6_X]EPZ51479.1 PF13664 domain protein [Bacteriovorax sp. BAL6_X]